MAGGCQVNERRGFSRRRASGKAKDSKFQDGNKNAIEWHPKPDAPATGRHSWSNVLALAFASRYIPRTKAGSLPCWWESAQNRDDQGAPLSLGMGLLVSFVC